MQRFRPAYYETFVCMADRCPRTCCQEWKIYVDEKTEKQWENLTPPQEVMPQKTALSDYIVNKEGSRVIHLDQAQRCPFLNGKKLCRLVCTYGDMVLSETCRVFPREVHVFEDHEEETLMPCCPAVIDLWEKGEPGFPSIPGDEDDFYLALRKEIMKLLEHTEQTLEEGILEASYILLELGKKKKPGQADVKDCFSEETRTELLKAIRRVEISAEDTVLECNELLQDLAVNYRAEGLYEDFLEPLLMLSESISEGEQDEVLAEKWKAFQKEWKDRESLIRNFLLNEIFSDLLSLETDIENILLRLEWITLEYVGIRQSVFLRWLLDGEEKISYEFFRDAIVVLTRMTGYEEEDIMEYLENSFQSPIWEWGYFALLLSSGIEG